MTVGTTRLAHPSTEPVGATTPVVPAHPWWWFLKSTPGKILMLGIVLATAGVLSAVATSASVQNRQLALSTVLNHTEPLAYSAGQLYSTLSVADAAATTAFIAGTEPQGVRERYEQAITDASTALVAASSGLTDRPMQELLSRINAELSVYTGLIETARTNNRASNPVGASYLSEASALMQHTILPDAQRLYEETSNRVDQETSASTRVPFPVILIVLATMIGGVLGHRWLSKQTRRLINPGMLAGGAALLLMVVWVGIALAVSASLGTDARNGGAHSLKTITQLVISAQQARADETLALIRRGDESVRKKSYYDRIDEMERKIGEYLSNPDAIARADLERAQQLLTRWRQADDRINAYIGVGNYQAATQVALGSSESDSTPAFDSLDAALRNGVQDSRRQLRSGVLNAERALTLSSAGALILSVGGAMCVGVGLWPRLSEYR